jgi:CRISPR-associated protein Cmr4
MTAQHHALYFVHALTPLHLGADQGLGAIDLPTLREEHTGWPIVPGSSIKGVLREQAEHHFKRDLAPEPTQQAEQAAWAKEKRDRERRVEGIFGPPTARAGDFRGGVVFGDAYPLLLPVRSLVGTFAWVTCKQVLRRVERDAEDASIADLELPDAPDGDKVLIAADGDSNKCEISLGTSRQILFEDLCLTAKPNPTVTQLAKTVAKWVWPRNQHKEREFLLPRLAVVPDDVFSYFCRHRLEIRARVSIDHATGIVGNGPWTEELIPAETVLCGILQARGTSIRERRREDEGAGPDVGNLNVVSKRMPDDLFKDLRAFLDEPRTLRVGGHASVGLGRARITMTPKATAKESSRS